MGDLPPRAQRHQSVARLSPGLRDRPYERDMDRSYLHDVNQAYENYFSDRGASVLVVDTNELNYVRYSEHLEWVANRIRQSLKLHPYQPELPLPIIE